MFIIVTKLIMKFTVNKNPKIVTNNIYSIRSILSISFQTCGSDRCVYFNFIFSINNSDINHVKMS